MIDAKSSIVSKTPQTISDCQKKWNFIELSSSLKWKVPKTSLTHHDRKNKFLMDLCFQKGTWRQSFLVLTQSLHSRTFSFWPCPYLWKRWKCKWDCTIHILTLFSFSLSLLDHWELALYKYCILYILSFWTMLYSAFIHSANLTTSQIRCSLLVMQLMPWCHSLDKEWTLSVAPWAFLFL